MGRVRGSARLRVREPAQTGRARGSARSRVTVLAQTGPVAHLLPAWGASRLVQVPES